LYAEAIRPYFDDVNFVVMYRHSTFAKPYLARIADLPSGETPSSCSS
jgi:hypothetical protein